MFFRTPYNYDVDKESQLTGIDCPEPTLTQQNTRDECDINAIVERFGVTGVLPAGARAPSYSDFGEVFDFQTAMNAVNEANAAFGAFPAHIRAIFHNDPQELLAFVEDDRNYDRALALGVIPSPPKQNESTAIKKSGDQPPPDPSST